MPGYLRIEQVRSTIGRTADQRATVRSLGLRRIRHVVVRPDRPEFRGMLRKVPHLVSFEEVDAPAEAAPKPVAAKPAVAKAPAKAPVEAPDEADTAAEAPAKPAAKVPAKKAPAKAAAKKAPAKKVPAKKAPAKKTTGRSGAGGDA
jgi:large subunit ribosomal protein L30